MSKEKYIIRYQFEGYIIWCYFIEMSYEDTSSYKCRDTVETVMRGLYNTDIMKMTLEEARKNIIEIKKIRKQKGGEITQIQIINTETYKIVGKEQKIEISRFELMEID